MKYDDLTPEMKERLRVCKTPEDVFALAKEAGYELTDEQIEGIAGGLSWDDVVDFLDRDCHTDID